MAACASCVIAIHAARAQACLGYPAFATGPINASLAVRVGSEFWGSGADFTVGRRASGPFVGAGVSTVTYVVDPKETRVAFGASAGYEKSTRDQLVFCPFASASYERGQEVDGDSGRERTSGFVAGVGVGIGAELTKRGPLAFDPFASARLTRIHTVTEHENAGNDVSDENGVSLVAGLAVRFRDAVQLAPSFSFSTFPGADLVFTLRFSIALQPRK
jgi:hypothetical protein